MKVCNNLDELLNILPKFIIPINFIDLYWYIKLKKNKKYCLLLSKKYILYLEKKFGEIEKPNYFLLNSEKEKLKNELYFNNKLKFFRSGKIIYYNDYVPDNMFQCDDCGSIWGNNNHCMCKEQIIL